MICASCQAEQPHSNRFCGQCGAPLAAVAATPPAPERPQSGERRQMTVMFYDLVGSTSLAAHCDPEDFGEAMDRVHAAVGRAVRDLGGYVGSRVGDGAVVYFGYPRAQEDAAERAALSGLRAADAVGRIILPNGQPAKIRVGIATGQGVVAPLTGGESGNEVVGTVANHAARLQSSAAPGTVVVSDHTRRLLRSLFEVEDLGRVEAKGFDQPMRAWRVVSQARAERGDLLSAKPAAIFVGRDRELALLNAAMAAAEAGEPRVVLVSGEAGLGKSHLIAAFAAVCQARGVLRVSLTCSARTQDTPLRPFVRQLRRANNLGNDTAGQRLTNLAPGTSADDAVLLARLVGAEAEDTKAMASLPGPQRLELTLEALTRQLAMASEVSPILVVFEDAHWADPTSLTLLERAVRTRPFQKALLVVTARPEFKPEWGDAPDVDHLMLRPLDAAQAATLIGALPGAERLSPSVRRAILERADGVPLFLEELGRAMAELAAEPEQRLAGEHQLPVTLQDSLLARLDRLGPVKHVAQVAAVIGRRFPRSLLPALAERSAEEIDAGSAG
jgi:class 3 adenylate cyclase